METRSSAGKAGQERCFAQLPCRRNDRHNALCHRRSRWDGARYTNAPSLSTRCCRKNGHDKRLYGCLVYRLYSAFSSGSLVGIDDPSLRLWPRQSGSAAALPMWARFMKEVYDQVEPYKSMTREEFEYPEGLIERLAISQTRTNLPRVSAPIRARIFSLKMRRFPEPVRQHGGSQTPSPSRVQRF